MDLPYYPRERVILEAYSPEWIVCSIGTCGILTRALVGKLGREYHESQRLALEFAHQVVRAVGIVPPDERVSTPHILVEAADALIDDPEHILLLATTWRYLPEGIEICSAGSNSVLLVEGTMMREVITPHTVLAQLQSQGYQLSFKQKMQIRNQLTRSLGSRKNRLRCRADEVQMALVSWSPGTTIAIFEDRLLVEDLLEHPVPRSELSSFIDAWPHPRGKTSVLISWGKEEECTRHKGEYLMS
ncbi:MAG TPA: hypothetical protein VKX46_18660 [Ktedonobacteraceae bacterium]|jgi:hypothetical protein|nr:hypothetical protein [Ktedonobacteraceae bacterium]